MRSLLIHNDNIQFDLIDKFENNSLKFEIPSATMMRESYSFDYEAHLILTEWFNEKNKYDTIIIPYNLSNDNYLELTGLRIAAHIRLTPEFNNIYTPIIFIGYETKEQIAKLSDLRTLLFTAGIFTTKKQNFLAIEKQIAWILENKPKITNEEYNKFLEIINIQPPANYTSHHSIDNEWALYKWAKYTKCANEIPEIKNRLESGLYFKFLKKQKIIPESEEQKEFIIDGKAKVLLIDDESEKGWANFYQHFFNYSPKITFKSLSIDYKSLNAEQIIEKANFEIKNFNPELVLLDLRLTDSDFIENNKPKDFSGYKILEKIKKENQGIQVIITTASNKVWNFLALKNLGADGYIVKSKDSDVKEDIEQLKKQVEKCFQNSYLKDIYSRIKTIKENLDKTSYDSEFINELKNQLDLTFVMLQIASKNDIYTKKCPSSEKTKEEKQFAYAFISLHAIVEVVNKQFVFKNDKDEWKIDEFDLLNWKWNNKKKKYENTGKNAEGFEIQKIVGVCIQKFAKYEHKDLHDIDLGIKKRNYFIHNDKKMDFKRGKMYVNHDIYTPEAFLNLFSALEKILNLL